MEQINNPHHDLLRRCVSGDISKAESDELFTWMHENGAGALPELEDLLENTYRKAINGPGNITSASSEQIWQELKTSIENIPSAPVIRTPFYRRSWFRYAAILLLIAGTTTYFYASSLRENPKLANSSSVIQDIPPGGDRAFLTLADGSKIILDSTQIGKVADQGSMKILKLDAGAIASEGLSGTNGFNTITTPKGGQYQVVLPDATHVWLNAASSIRFPATFYNNRSVEITGEAYFEVAQDPGSAFFVTTGHASVQVLGTSFNVNSYMDDGSEKTTLLQGSIRMIPRGEFNEPASGITIKPGQQVRYGLNSGTELVKNIDIAQIMARKNGLISPQNADFGTVARQLERWYDIEIRYEGAVPNVRFKGGIDRGLPLSGVVRFLTSSGIHIRLEGKTLIILK